MRNPLFPPLSREESFSQASVLCLAATVEPGQAGDVTSTVLARVTSAPDRGGTVVLALEGAVDADCLQALCSLQERLRALGVCLRLAIRPEQPRNQAPSMSVPSLAIHPTLRSALLAAYAARLGPGVVTAQVRAALSVPAEPLQGPVTSGGSSRRSDW